MAWGNYNILLCVLGTDKIERRFKNKLRKNLFLGKAQAL
jgi:hypothetical protein